MDDERNALEPKTNTNTTRRRLLRAATGGFALAACGLFLPEGLAETAAREGILGGAKGGRRGADHKGQHRRRSHGDKKDKGQHGDEAPPQSHGPFRTSALTVFNRVSWPLTCTFFYRVKTGLDDYALPTADGERTLAPNQWFRYDPDRYRVGVLIKGMEGYYAGNDFYADVRNVSFWFPRGGVSAGRDLDPHGGKFGGAFIEETAFITGMSVGGPGKPTLKRDDDSAQRIEWEFIFGSS